MEKINKKNLCKMLENQQLFEEETGCDLYGSEGVECEGYPIKLKNTIITNFKFENVKLFYAEFNNCKFENCEFNTELWNTKFECCEFRNCNFKDEIYDVEFRNCNFNKCNFDLKKLYLDTGYYGTENLKFKDCVLKVERPIYEKDFAKLDGTGLFENCITFDKIGIRYYPENENGRQFWDIQNHFFHSTIASFYDCANKEYFQKLIDEKIFTVADTQTVTEYKFMNRKNSMVLENYYPVQQFLERNKKYDKYFNNFQTRLWEIERNIQDYEKEKLIIEKDIIHWLILELENKPLYKEKIDYTKLKTEDLIEQMQINAFITYQDKLLFNAVLVEFGFGKNLTPAKRW